MDTANGQVQVEDTFERRREGRLRYHWPVWFAEDFNDVLTQGQMVDVSSRGAAFTCYADHSCPYPGQRITARFSVPNYAQHESFNMANFVRAGHVLRVEQLNPALRRVAMQFFDPLPFKPAEHSEEYAESAPQPAGAY